MKWFFVSLFSSLWVCEVLAAACCSAGGTASPLMTEQTHLELRLSTSRSFVVAERFESEKTLFWDTERKQVTTTITPSLGYRLTDDWQLGLSADLVAKNYTFDGGGNQRKNKFGDTRIMLGYELIYPTPSFVWTPQMFISLEQSILSGRGLEESQSFALVDVSGSDQSATILGWHLFKKLNSWRLSFEARHSYFHTRELSSVKLQSRRENAVSLGAQTTNLSRYFNLGLNFSGFFKQGRRRVGQLNSLDERYFDTSMYALFSVTERSHINFSYIDQTLLGSVKNTTLSRRFAVMYSYSLER